MECYREHRREVKREYRREYYRRYCGIENLRRTGSSMTGLGPHRLRDFREEERKVHAELARLKLNKKYCLHHYMRT